MQKMNRTCTFSLFSDRVTYIGWRLRAGKFIIESATLVGGVGPWVYMEHELGGDM
jgi:hypothetical protein